VKGVVRWIKLYPFRIWLAFALAVVMSLVIGIVRSFGSESVPPRPVSSHAAPPLNGETVTGQVTEAGLTLNYPGGASLSVPAGALPAGTVVAITKGKAATLHQLGALQPDGVSWDVAASVEPPSLPVTLVLPYDPAMVPAGAHPLVTTYDELSGWWEPVKTTSVPETGKLIAELPGFSLKTWILDRAPTAGRGAETWLEYQGRKLLRRRTDRPQCANRPVPPWVKPVVVNAGAGVSACVRGDGEGFAVEAANALGYPVTLDLDAPYARARSSALNPTVDDLLTQLPGGVLLPPTGKSAIAYNPLPAPVGTVQGRVRRDGDTMVRWLVFEVAGGTPAARTTVGPSAVECGKRALSGPAAAEQRVSTLLDCLAQALDRQLRAGGFDVTADLWRSDGVSRLPAAQAQAIGVLRWVRGLQAGNFAQLAGEVTSGSGQGATGRTTVLASWADAPRWARPAGVTPLFDLVGTASVPGPSGQRMSARLAGRSYPDSTGAWVACADPPATLAYDLAGKFRRLTAVVGLAESAPADLAVRFQLTADGRPVVDSVVDHRHTATVNVDVSNVDSLVVSAVRTAGDCPSSPLPFGVLGEASLFP
jgi:NPCBM/NEW2 domain